MSPWFTLIGVFLGALATFSATTLTERTRWRRAQDSRWDERRLHSYVEYANAVKKVVSFASRVMVARGVSAAGGQPLDVATGLPLLAEAEDERSLKWENVLLLGSNTVIDAGRQWHRIAWRLAKFAQEEQPDEHEVEAAYTAYNDARAAFYGSARGDLGLKESEISVPVATV
jgi:hypothetical protein